MTTSTAELRSKQDTGKLINTLIAQRGKQVKIETFDGVTREGQMTAVTIKGMRLTIASHDIDTVLEWPAELELHGEADDRIPISRISHLTIK